MGYKIQSQTYQKRTKNDDFQWSKAEVTLTNG